jgi:hypothetical protein
MLKRSFLILAVSAVAAACGAKFDKKGSDSPAAATPASGQPPPVLAPGAQNYSGQQLDPNTGLNGMGHWVNISDQRFFVPDQTQLQNRNDWQPYQDGRWTYDNDRGWTWVSSEPWGWMTDHYGVWRHHRQHGWIWLPFKDMHYEPHTVTWFDEGDNIGWYPMFDGYAQAYTLNDRYGFDDGYWQGRTAILSIGGSAFGFNFGFTMVNRSQVTYDNLRSYVIRDRHLVLNTVYRAHQGDRIKRVGRHPGGDKHHSHDFVQRYSTRRAPVGNAQWVNSRGGARILQPFNGRGHDSKDNDRRDNDRRDNDRRDNDRRDNDRRDNDRRDDRRDGDRNGRGGHTPPVVQPTPRNNNGGGNNSTVVQPARPRDNSPSVAQPARPALPQQPAQPQKQPPRRDNPPAQTGIAPAVVPPAAQPPAKERGQRPVRERENDDDKDKRDDNRREKRNNDGDENRRRPTTN